MEVASRTGIDKNKINWFIEKIKTDKLKNDELKPEEIEHKIEKACSSKRLENIRKRKREFFLKKEYLNFHNGRKILLLRN